MKKEVIEFIRLPSEQSLEQPKNQDILTIIKNRRSIRHYQSKPIPKETIEKLIEALIWAPSAGNLQSRKFYFVFNQEVKEKLATSALKQEFISETPFTPPRFSKEKVVEIISCIFLVLLV